MLKRIACLLLVAGCSASPPPPATDASKAERANEEQQARSVKPAEPADPGSQRDGFMKGCLETTSGKDYCECAFLQYVEVFRNVDLAEGADKNEPYFLQLGEQTKAQCADKLPEDEVKKAFVADCASKDSTREPYCGCAWGELRKTLSVAFLLNFQEGDPKWVQARQQIPKGCKGKYPAALAQREFTSRCQSDGTTEKQCVCLFGKIAKKFTIEEIHVGTADVAKVPGLDTCK